MTASPSGSAYRWLTRPCDHCEKPALIVEPGSEEIRELFLLKRDAPPKCWCLQCWTQRFGERA